MKASYENMAVTVEFTQDECRDQYLLTHNGNGDYKICPPDFILKFGDKVVKIPCTAMSDGLDVITLNDEDESPPDYLPDTSKM